MCHIGSAPGSARGRRSFYTHLAITGEGTFSGKTQRQSQSLSGRRTKGARNQFCADVETLDPQYLNRAYHSGSRPMFTDAPPRKNRAEFLESDRIKTLEVPKSGKLVEIAKRLESARKTGNIREVRGACTQFLGTASDFYQVADCGIRVLAARPLRVRESSSTELFGDYTPETMLIRVWMRTAVRKEVRSFGTFLSTFCHEFCHHLDFQKSGFTASWHTRGFYERAAVLYHHALGTPPKRLFWVAMPGVRGRIDWPRTNRSASR